MKKSAARASWPGRAGPIPLMPTAASSSAMTRRSSASRCPGKGGRRDMYWLDFVLLLVLGIGAFLGARSGLLWQVARVITFFLAIYACIHYHGIAAGWLLQNLRAESPVVPWLLAYLVTFLSVYAVCMVITYALERMLRAAKLKPMDRLLGALVGAVKAGLLAGAVLL